MPTKWQRLVHKTLLGLRNFALTVLAVCLYALLMTAGATWHLNRADDLAGYLVHVERTAQTGRYGPDPFNARSIESGLGGYNQK